MSTPTDNAVLIAHRARLAVSGVLLIYRADGEAFRVWVVPGSAGQVDDGDEVAAVNSRTAEFVVATEDLYHQSKAIEPARGHEADWTDDAGVKHTYQVFAGDDGRCYRFCDRGRLLMRIYAVETAPNTETAE